MANKGYISSSYRLLLSLHFRVERPLCGKGVKIQQKVFTQAALRSSGLGWLKWASLLFLFWWLLALLICQKPSLITQTEGALIAATCAAGKTLTATKPRWKRKKLETLISFLIIWKLDLSLLYSHFSSGCFSSLHDCFMATEIIHYGPNLCSSCFWSQIIYFLMNTSAEMFLSGLFIVAELRPEGRRSNCQFNSIQFYLYFP